MICENCKREFIAMLEHRIKRILSVGKQCQAEDMSAGLETSDDIGQSKCFHFMELQRMVEGKPVSEMYS